eukprot:TRINITY_DN10476_c3_g1_i1.p1 TRINITY_DN10476_c3_g1~~TRINITY_DN10476_c3_g1_i1.p1  ORF type:complete len:125 (-),score=14.44 TRINITY_DN10476_c3_g1_i1:210-584(-)
MCHFSAHPAFTASNEALQRQLQHTVGTAAFKEMKERKEKEDWPYWHSANFVSCPDCPSQKAPEDLGVKQPAPVQCNFFLAPQGCRNGTKCKSGQNLPFLPASAPFQPVPPHRPKRVRERSAEPW